MDTFNIIAGSGVLLVLAGTAFVAVFQHTRSVTDFLQKYTLWYIASVTLLSVVGSLIYSDVWRIVPCPLCWYQRIFMFAIPVIVFTDLLLQKKDSLRYVLPLASIGLLISAYQILLQTGLFEQALFCEPGSIESCSIAVVEVFNIISIPVMAGIVFLSVVMVTIFALRHPLQRNR